MKKIFMFFIGMLMSSVTFAQDIAIIDDVVTYNGSEPFVYSKKDGKVYAYNSMNEYEQYGLYTKVTSLAVASGNDMPIDYIEAVAGMEVSPYINSGYMHTAQTRVVVNCTLTDGPNDGIYAWQSVFGARNGITSAAMIFFSEQNGNRRGGIAVGNTETWGEDGVDIPRETPIVIDMQGETAKVYYASEYPGGSPYITISGGTPSNDVTCPLMIFTNNNNSGRVGSDTHYGNSSALMKLTRFQIFEGEETDPRMDLKPYVLTTGDAGLKDMVTEKRFHAEEGYFAVPEDVELDQTGGIAVYTGKRVCNTTDNHEYKWDGEKWVDLGEMKEVPIEVDFDYANMIDNWTCPDDKYSCFGINRGNNAENTPTAYYDEETKDNQFPNYLGTSYHEPIGVQLPATVGTTYRYSFDFGSETGWGCSWTSTTMHAGVLDNANLTSNGFAEPCTALGGSNGVLAFQKLTTAATLDDNGDFAPVHYSMDFIADKNSFYLFFPFGYVSDGEVFHFSISNISVAEVVYPDLYNELNLTKPVLQVLLAEVADFAGSTTDKLQAELDAAKAAAEAAVAGTDEEAMKEALAALQEAYSAAQAVNIKTLRETVALAKAEGIVENIAEAEAFFVDGEEASVGNDLLNKIRNARRLIYAERYENVFTGNEPENYGEYYLYNVGQKRFFCGGDDWGAHAAVGYPGIIVTLYDAFNDDGIPTEGAFEIDTHLNNGGDSEYLNYGGYCDTATMDDWMFVPVDGKPGVYNIVRAVENEDEENGSLLGFRKGTYARVDTDMADANDPDNQWILVTADDRLALLADATAENPVDATWMLNAPGFNQREKADDSEWGWTIEKDPIGGGPNTGIWAYGSNYPDFVFECWNGGNNNNMFMISQDFEAPEDGWYIFAVQGYYRDGSIAKQIETIEEGGELISEAYLSVFQGSAYETVALKNLFDEEALHQAPGYQYYNADNVGGVPNSCSQAFQFFQLGKYWNVLKIKLNGGEWTSVMVDKDTETLEDWTVIDNFRMIYCGADEPDETAIGSILDESLNNAPAKIYNLQGMQVKNAKQNGVYINNGKKFVVK